ncbi:MULTISPECIES: energy transducer TonB [Xanthomonas translucens group]|uniref:Energy transducer TonB n=1 Tax=Xanthomonas cerealis pv. cerealis TaxID=152263 RepID=A0A514EBB7_9XANT|nr:energy transducer TonB [Xanthomonas translucens]QDI03336.1 energy transducer TonB [Xanthomonas translucens pv. cerealis]UKE45701.1 energy transducer TonB [Xanthomonas translucens pv. cerealis]UKE71185.1 energy transducer TonB [Xanthomonas translucens pv. pistacia]
MSTSPPSSNSGIVLRLPRRLLVIVGIAFCAGLLLFLAVWLVGRKDNDFYKPQPAQVHQDAAEVKPLPEPLPASSGASDMPQAKPPTAEDAPKLVETAPPAPLPADTMAALPGATEGAAAGTNATVLAPGDRPVPLEGQAPPRYPSAALRSGDSGTVVVRVEVDASGIPGGVALVRRSGSRELDRAAMEAVRRWRFRPAQQNGQAVAGSLEIPFDFKPAQ